MPNLVYRQHRPQVLKPQGYVEAHVISDDVGVRDDVRSG
jgi:hypothetical protein